MNPTQLFMLQKTRQAIVALEGARVRAQQQRTLLGLALVISRVQINQLVSATPSVRAAMFRLRTQTGRQAARLVAEQVSCYQAEPYSEVNSNALRQTIQACDKVFPREAALLRACVSV